MSITTRQTIDNQSFWGAAIGTMLEYYDNGLFVIFLPFLAPLFFPGRSGYDAMMEGYVILLVAFLARPLGGLFFGYWGDRFGRKKSLLLTIYGIAFATLMIGLLPGRAHIGWLATVLLLVCKAVQYFSFGGEFSGAGIYVVEHAPAGREGYWSSLLTANTILGTLLAALLGIFLTEPEMPHYAWRIAFVFGGVLGCFVLFYRRHMLESPVFKRVPQSKDWRGLFRSYYWQMITAMMAGAIATIPFYIVVGFINPMLMFQKVITSSQLMYIQASLSALAVLTLIVFGRLEFSCVRQMRISVWCILCLAPILLYALDHQKLVLLFTVEALFTMANETFLGPTNAYLKTLFPMFYRYRGVAISFALGSSLFGALTPLLANQVHRWTGDFILLTPWFVTICAAMLLLLYYVKADY